jgi:uncharacterized protein DUF6174
MKGLCLLLALVLLSGCGIFEPESDERREYDDALAAWKRLGIVNYSFVHARSCECIEAWTRPARVTVRAGRVVEASDLASGETRNVDYYLTIDGLFERIKNAFEDRAWRIEIDYDRQMHYPASTFIDEDRNIADEEFDLQIHGLTVIQ